MVRALLRTTLVLAIVSVLLLSSMSAADATNKRFDGMTVNVFVATGSLAETWKKWAPEWEKQTGAKVNLIETAYEAMYEKVMTELALGTGAFDIIQYPPFWNGDIMGGGFVLPLDDFIASRDPDWDDYVSIYRDTLSSWGGEVYGIQIDGDIFTFAYRKDLFDDPDEQAAFRAEYGYDLAPPETWEHLLDMSEFFTRDRNGDGRLDLWGHADIAGRSRSSMWHFFSRFFSYLDAPYLYQGGAYFDVETMEPLINTPAGVKALEMFKESVDPKRAPPGVLSYGVSEPFEDFIQDRVVMTYQWADLGPLSIDPNRSKILGEAGFSLLPGATQVWSLKEERWVEVDGIHRVSPVAWGWTLAIAATTRVPEAAYDLIHFMVTGERSIDQAIDSWDGMDPYRISHFRNPQVLEHYKQIPEFLPSLQANLEIGIPDLRIPGTMEYYDVLELYITEYLSGRIKTAEEALNKTAEEWNSITRRRGLQDQLNSYRASIGLGPK